jgi:hypothetical protein
MLNTMTGTTSLAVSPPPGGTTDRSGLLASWLVIFAIAFCGFSALTATVSVDKADAMTYQSRWYGMDVQLNRRETNNLMFGWGAATAVAAAIPHPVARAVGGVAFGLSTAYANWAYNRGACLKFQLYLTRTFSVNHYYGGSCR